MLTVLAVVIFLVAGVSLAMTFALRSFLYTQLDQRLAQDAQRTHAGFYFTPKFDYRGQRPQGSETTFALAFTRAGEAVKPNPALADTPPISPTRFRWLAGHAGQGPFFMRVRNVSLRAQVVQAGSIVSVRGVAPVYVLIGLPTTNVDRTLGRLKLLDVAIGTAGIAFALVAIPYGVRRNLRTLREVTKVAGIVARDVSPESPALRQRVPLANVNLHSEVGHLAVAMNTLLGAVEGQITERAASESRMRQFLLDASHELRTPLTSIRGYAELARLHRIASSPARNADPRDDALDRIEAEGRRMSKLVDDLLTLARQEAGAAHSMDLIEADQVVAAAVQSARAAYPSRRFELSTVPGIVIVGDHDELLRAVMNLLVNAAVHTPADGGAIKTMVRRSEMDVLIQVQDEGPGLSQDEAAHVFDRFWRADKSRSRAQGGNGLGMAIVASIVHRHGGRVAFQSSVEGGTTVTIRLPDTGRMPLTSYEDHDLQPGGPQPNCGASG